MHQGIFSIDNFIIDQLINITALHSIYIIYGPVWENDEEAVNGEAR